MVKNYISVFFFICSFAIIVKGKDISGDTLKIHGQFVGESLIVLNPIKDSLYSVSELLVNSLPAAVEIKSSAFEIDFAAMGIQYGDSVIIEIIYNKLQGIPEVLNPEAVKPKTVFRYVNADIDKKNLVIYWTVEANSLTESFEVEHFRWDKWLTVSVVSPAGKDGSSSYSSPVIPHSGKNIFRIKYIDSEGNYFYSGELKLTSKVREVTLVSDKVKDKIDFSDETFYQLFDENGYLILEGIGSEIDVLAMGKGKYFLNFDNKTVTVFKK